VTRRAFPLAVAFAAALGALPVARAHAGSLASAGPVSIPSWLFFLTGGGIVVGSFLLSTFVTDRALVRAIHERGPAIRADLLTPLAHLAGILAVPALFAVVVVGLVGPASGIENAAVLVVWVGWWAGYAMTTYLVGNTWPAINPWRTLAEALPSLDRTLPERWGVWPSVVGLLGLVWLEVVSPLADDPRLLAAVVVAYTLLTLAGAAVVGADAWFRRVDPVATVFRWYGRVAPLQYEDGRLTVRAPGTPLTGAGLAPSAGRERRPPDEQEVRADGTGVGWRRPAALVDGVDGTAFVVALVWATTYDGLVGTPLWADAVRALAALGAPPLLVSLGVIAAGFALFLAAYRGASRLARRTAGSYVAAETIARRFVPALVPIAAGYHLAHFSGYLLTLSPALAATLASPLSPPATLPAFVLPGWFSGVQLAFVVLGHVLAVWVAHTIAFDTFVGRLQPIRSQYPYILVMTAYTMTSMWLLAQPYAPPPYL
jgi:hypothetical protein